MNTLNKIIFFNSIFFFFIEKTSGLTKNNDYIQFLVKNFK